MSSEQFTEVFTSASQRSTRGVQQRGYSIERDSATVVLTTLIEEKDVKTRNSGPLARSAEEGVILPRHRSRSSLRSSVDRFSNFLKSPTILAWRVVNSLEDELLPLWDNAANENVLTGHTVKYEYTFMVLNTFVFVACAENRPYLLTWYHAIVYSFSYMYRVYSFAKQQFSLYCIDFCYMVNLSMILYVLFFRDSVEVFKVLFSAVSIFLLPAVVFFKNRVVFHSFDYTISTMIHIAPALITYAVRWMRHEPNGINSLSGIHYAMCDDPTSCLTWLDWTVFPLCFKFAWDTIVWMISDFVQTRMPHESGTRRWIDERAIHGKILNKLWPASKGTRSKARLWMLLPILNMSTLPFVPLAYLCWHYRAFHRGILIFVLLCAIFNGASYYESVFHRHMKEMKANIEQTLASESNVQNLKINLSSRPTTQQKSKLYNGLRLSKADARV